MSMTVLVYGLGRSGAAVARLLRQQGHRVLVYDRQPDTAVLAELQALGCDVTTTPTSTAAQLCIAAPGVPYDHPDLQSLRSQGLETIGEVEWVYRSVKAEIIGVTGTAGKGTVTRWLSDALTAAGKDAPAGGNIDPALAAVAHDGATLVVELSSFQLERCPTLKPNIAIALNLHIDHLDRHGSIERYHAAKHQLIANLDENDIFIYNLDDPILQSWAKDSRAKTLGFSLLAPHASRLSPHAFLDADTLMLHGEPLLSASDLSVQGKHHVANALAVALAGDAQGLSRADICAGLMAFQGLPGRYSLVESVGKLRFIEDSIATRTLAVKAALEATAAPIVWLAGGQDKGASFDELETLIRDKVVLFISIGEAGERFASKVQTLTQTLVVTEPQGDEALERACQAGADFLKEHYPDGGTVLLAPLAASFDQFRDYQDRANAFRRAVETVTANIAARKRAWTLC